MTWKHTIKLFVVWFVFLCFGPSHSVWGNPESGIVADEALERSKAGGTEAHEREGIHFAVPLPETTDPHAIEQAVEAFNESLEERGRPLIRLISREALARRLDSLKHGLIELVPTAEDVEAYRQGEANATAARSGWSWAGGGAVLVFSAMSLVAPASGDSIGATAALTAAGVASLHTFTSVRFPWFWKSYYRGKNLAQIGLLTFLTQFMFAPGYMIAMNEVEGIGALFGGAAAASFFAALAYTPSFGALFRWAHANRNVLPREKLDKLFGSVLLPGLGVLVGIPYVASGLDVTPALYEGSLINWGHAVSALLALSGAFFYYHPELTAAYSSEFIDKALGKLENLKVKTSNLKRSISASCSALVATVGRAVSRTRHRDAN